MVRRSLRVAVLVFLVAGLAACAADPLPSWNDTATKRAIVGFVGRVTTAGSAEYVRPAERVAVFDNDGTLWCEQPMYFQLAFAMENIRKRAAEHPEWKEQEPYKTVLAGDVQRILDDAGLRMMILGEAAFSGMTTEEYSAAAKEWLRTARHPVYGRPYTECVYQPMLELLAYLRGHGFKTFIVSGGGVEFMRNFAERVYGIPPEQVVGSSAVNRFELRDGKPVLVKQGAVEFVDDGPGKAVGINRFIGRRPVMAFGNSDGDLQMLEYTAGGAGARFCAYVHHTDGEREVAYDRESHVGKLDKGLDEARAKGWTLIDMRRDWKTVFPGR
jgi:phosphoserine phosphatase